MNYKYLTRRSPGLSRWRLCALALCALAACASAPELNSERIQKRYGSYGVEVLSQSEELRVANLFSRDADGATCRTLAITRFEATAAQDFPAAHAAIRAGASIGATLQQHGWQVRKLTRHVGPFVAPEDARLLEDAMRLESPPPLALHVYLLQAAKAGDVRPYATIIELHHPDYWSPAALVRQYADAPRRALPPAGVVEVEELTARIARGVFM